MTWVLVLLGLILIFLVGIYERLRSIHATLLDVNHRQSSPRPYHGFTTDGDPIWR